MQASFTFCLSPSLLYCQVVEEEVLVEVIVTSNLLGRLVVHVGMQCLRTANANGQTGQVFWGAQKGGRRGPGVSHWKGSGSVHASQRAFNTFYDGEQSQKVGKSLGTDLYLCKASKGNIFEGVAHRSTGTEPKMEPRLAVATTSRRGATRA